MYGFNSFMFSVVPVMVTIGFIAVIGIIIFSAVKGGIRWNKNNNSPLLTVPAKAVTKRMNISHHYNGSEMPMSSSSTIYYVTFEVESGDRIEFSVSGKEYGILVEGDAGLLTFQGTRYKGFARKNGI